MASRLSPAAERFRRQRREVQELKVTYNEAKKWLEKLGGSWTEGKEQIPHTGSVIVTVESVKRGSVSRHALFDDRLQGYQRQLAIQKAFVQAVENLKYELSR